MNVRMANAHQCSVIGAPLKLHMLNFFCQIPALMDDDDDDDDDDDVYYGYGLHASNFDL